MIELSNEDTLHPPSSPPDSLSKVFFYAIYRDRGIQFSFSLCIYVTHSGWICCKISTISNCSLEKNQVPRELTLIAISLTCLVAQWSSYGGSWKRVTILPILVGIVQLSFAICFCIPPYVDQQLHSLDCQKFGHHNSLVFFTYFRTSPGEGFHFWKGTYNFQNCLRIQFVQVCAH